MLLFSEFWGLLYMLLSNCPQNFRVWGKSLQVFMSSLDQHTYWFRTLWGNCAESCHFHPTFLNPTDLCEHISAQVSFSTLCLNAPTPSLPFPHCPLSTCVIPPRSLMSPPVSNNSWMHPPSSLLTISTLLLVSFWLSFRALLLIESMPGWHAW